MPKLHPVIARAAQVVPSPRQLAWQKLEFYSFIHYGINTYTDREWGDGTEDPALFNPTKLDCRQWAKVCKAAGMRGLILTAKHHDGFCLWPSAATKHSVESSPWKDGKGDVVRECAEACAEVGIKFGLYLSPWDQNAPSYGQGKAYDDFYETQLRELLTNYGELFCLWFDGACGEGKNGKTQAYDWERYYAVIRELQPNAAICIVGPDVRWVGNEAGVCRPSEWSVVPSFLSKAEVIAAASQQEDGKAPTINLDGDDAWAAWDIGSRKQLMKHQNWAPIWYPAEVDVSIRKGWFYHANEDHTVKPLAKLREIYYKSVGANASLLLNIPPTPQGVIHERDVDTLISLGAQLKVDFKENLIEGSTMTASCQLDDAHGAQNIVLPGSDSYWHSGELHKPAELVLDLGDDLDINKLVLKEHIATGQQIEAFKLYIDQNTEETGASKWKLLEKGTIIGHKRIIQFNETRVRRFKLVITECRGFATLEEIEAY
ncbi:MAG: alpha-L-fucosidase [Oscillospiraceae bacterium]|nr:alpha-L-fucosidase [Oscillospiraceae bacterium]